jgi:hypothetical protein
MALLKSVGSAGRGARTPRLASGAEPETWDEGEGLTQAALPRTPRLRG